MTENHLLKRWNNDQLIGIDSLIRSDGSAVILTCYCGQNPEKKYYCFPLCDTTIAGIEKYDDDMWSEVQSFVQLKDETTGRTYLAGEGAMGNEGFITCLDANKEPVWGLFFQNSNPFYELEIKDGILEAISSLDLKFQIDLESPEKIKITYFEWIG